MCASVPQRLNEREVDRVDARYAEQDIRKVTHVQNSEVHVDVSDDLDRELKSLYVSTHLFTSQRQVRVLGSKLI